jgi:ankyrin repeat protein
LLIVTGQNFSKVNMSLSHLPPELLELILANIFPNEWNFYPINRHSRAYLKNGPRSDGLWDIDELGDLSLRTVCRKYLKRIFWKFPLDNGVLGGFNQGVLELLTERNMVGRNLLHWAAFYGHERLVQRLLEKKMDVAGKDSFGRTVLSRAAMKGYKTVVELLLEKGADIKSKDDDGQTPLSWAAENGHEVVVKLLLEKGADAAGKDKSGQTALSRAAMKGHKTVVELLLEKGADVKPKGGVGQTPLWWAARNGNEVVVKLLLEKGADVESEDTGDCRMPLSWAAGNGHEAW